MQHSIRKIATVAALLVSGLASLNANAYCFQSAQIVERVIAYNSGNGYIYFRPRTALSNSSYYYCYARGSDAGYDAIMSTAAAAQTSRTEVNVYGEADTCPTSGTGRYMGDCYYLYMVN
jgi:hypothetical protein